MVQANAGIWCTNRHPQREVASQGESGEKTALVRETLLDALDCAHDFFDPAGMEETFVQGMSAPVVSQIQSKDVISSVPQVAGR